MLRTSGACSTARVANCSFARSRSAGGVTAALLAQVQAPVPGVGEFEHLGGIDQGQKVIGFVTQFVGDLGEAFVAAACGGEFEEAAEFAGAGRGQGSVEFGAFGAERREGSRSRHRLAGGAGLSGEDAVDLVDEGLERGTAPVPGLRQSDLLYRARGMAEEEATAKAAETLPNPHEKPVMATPDHDKQEAVGTGLGAATSSFLFFGSGAILPVLPYLFGLEGITAPIVPGIIVGLDLLTTGAIVALLPGGVPLKMALRQLAMGYGAAAVTYLLGMLFGTSTA